MYSYMNVFIEINNKIYNYNLNESYSLKRDFDTLINQKSFFSEFLYKKIKEDTGIESKYYFLKYKNIELFGTENLLKILDEDENCNIDFIWNDFDNEILSIAILDQIYRVPKNIAEKSKLLENFIEASEDTYTSELDLLYFDRPFSRNLSDKNDKLKLVFNSCKIINSEFIRDWIKLSYLVSNFLKNESKDKLNIPKPLVTRMNFKDNNMATTYLILFVGKETVNFLNTLDNFRIKYLLKGFEYLDVSDLLDLVCCYFSTIILDNKSIEEFKKLIY